MAKEISYSGEIMAEDTEKAMTSIEPTLIPTEAAPYAVDFAGECPRCGHGFHYRAWFVAIAGAARMSDEQRRALAEEITALAPEHFGSGDETFDLVCDCEANHPNRPKDKTGCGAGFRLRVVWP